MPANASDKSTSFSIKFDSDESVDAAVKLEDGLISLQKGITDSQDRVKNLSSSLRLLKGSSDEVKAAKTELKAKIEAENAAITKNNLALVKQGLSYNQVTTAVKKQNEAAAKGKEGPEKLGKAMSSIGGPLGSLRDRLSSLKELFANTGSTAGLAVVGVTALAAVIAVVTAAAVTGVIALGKWILEIASAKRTAGLFREAALGSAQGAKDLGMQIDALAQKVSTPKEKIDQLAVSLSKMRLNGHEIVDTLNLVTQASDAMGDDVGKKLEDIVTRSQMSGRLGLNPMELLGTNIDFSEVAKNLAQQTHVGVDLARRQLLQGRAPLEEATAALRKTVEQKFAGLNLRKMLDIHVIAEKFKETLANLTGGVNIEPALKAFAELAKLFDKSTITGSGLKTLVTLLGNGMVKLFVAGMPLAQAAMNGVMIAALSATLAFLKLQNAWKRFAKENDLDDSLITTQDVLRGAEIATYSLITALVIGAAVVALMAAPFVAAALAVVKLVDAVSDAYDYLGAIDWAEAGGNIVAGLVEGIKSHIPDATGMIGGLADSIAKSFTDRLKIASPSKLFKEYGAYTVEGYTDGIDDNAPKAQASVQAMAPTMKTGSGSASGSSGQASITVGSITIQVDAKGAKDPQAVADALRAPSVTQALIKLLSDAAASGELTPAT